MAFVFKAKSFTKLVFSFPKSNTRFIHTFTPLSTNANNLVTTKIDLPDLTHPGGRQSVNGIVATVFGASGFIGTQVVNALGRIGSQVVVPYRGDGLNARDLKLAGDLGQIIPLPYTFSDKSSVQKTLERSNICINLLGSARETTQYSYHDVHVKATYRICEAAKSAGIETFIHMSAYGAHPDSPSDFFRSKAEGEAVVKSFFPDAIILRPTAVFGDRDGWLSAYGTHAVWLSAFILTRKGQRLVQPVFVHDVSRAVLGAITNSNSRGRTYDLAGPKIYTEREIVDMVIKQTHRSMWVWNWPDIVAKQYGEIIGGRNTPKIPEDSKDNIFRILLRLPRWFASRIRFSGVYYGDKVEQAKIDLVPASGTNDMKELGVTGLTPIEDQLETIMTCYSLFDAVDRFSQKDRVKRDAARHAQGF